MSVDVHGSGVGIPPRTPRFHEILGGERGSEKSRRRAGLTAHAASGGGEEWGSPPTPYESTLARSASLPLVPYVQPRRLRRRGNLPPLCPTPPHPTAQPSALHVDSRSPTSGVSTSPRLDQPAARLFELERRHWPPYLGESVGSLRESQDKEKPPCQPSQQGGRCVRRVRSLRLRPSLR